MNVARLPRRLRTSAVTEKAAFDAGADCRGEVYQDDGKYRTGGFMRESFTCAVNADGTLTVEMGRRAKAVVDGFAGGGCGLEAGKGSGAAGKGDDEAGARGGGAGVAVVPERSWGTGAV